MYISLLSTFGFPVILSHAVKVRATEVVLSTRHNSGSWIQTSTLVFVPFKVSQSRLLNREERRIKT